MAEVEGTKHNLDDPISISHELLHDEPTDINRIIDKRVTFQEDPQDVDERVHLAIDHLDQSSSDDTEYSSSITETDDDSTYIPSDDSDVDHLHIEATVE